MKKILLLLLVFPVFGFGQGSEDFTNSTATATYADGSFVGTSGLTFTFGHSRDQDTYGISGTGLMLRRASDSYLSVTIPSGVGNFSFDYRKAFTGASPRQLELLVNGVSVGMTPEFGTISGTDETTVYNFNYDVNTASSVTLTIKNIGSSTTNKQAVIDNILWTAYGAAGCNITASGLANTSCNDATTSSDPADDYITFDLNPTGADLGTTYTVSVPTGTITPTTGTYGSATSFQLQNGSAGAGNVTVTITDNVDGGCTFDQVITDPGVCSSAAPVITVNPTLLTGFTHIVGTPSAEQTFTVSGLALSSDIVITAPTNYEISLTTGTGFTNVINLAPITGTVPNTTIYVRENASALGLYNETILITSTGATDEEVNLEGTANDYVEFTIDEIDDLDGNGVATALNTLVELNGVVHCMDFDGNAGYSFTIIDNSGKGINVFRTSDLPNYTNPMSGDSIIVRGSIIQFNGLLEVQADSINLLTTDAELVTPTVVTMLSEATESQYITLENLTFVTPITNFPTGSNNINVTDGTNTFVLRIDSDTDIPGTPAPQYTFTVTGIGGQFDSSSPYDSGYQLFPCGTSSFVPSCSTPDVSVSVAGFTITAATTGATITYQWIDCSDNSEIDGETAASFTPTVDGDYAVIITDDVCSDTSVCTTIAGLSIAKNELTSAVTVYPNPVQNELTVSNVSNTSVSINVFDINGKLIFNSSSVSEKTTIETSSWNKGVYFVEISNGNATVTHKVVK